MDSVSQMPAIRTAFYNGRHITYASDTRFFLEVGSHVKNAFKTVLIIQGDFDKALRVYNSITLKPGWKKRLRLPDLEDLVIVRDARRL